MIIKRLLHNGTWLAITQAWLNSIYQDQPESNRHQARHSIKARSFSKQATKTLHAMQTGNPRDH